MYNNTSTRDGTSRSGTLSVVHSFTGGATLAVLSSNRPPDFEGTLEIPRKAQTPKFTSTLRDERQRVKKANEPSPRKSKLVTKLALSGTDSEPLDSYRGRGGIGVTTSVGRPTIPRLPLIKQTKEAGHNKQEKLAFLDYTATGKHRGAGRVVRENGPVPLQDPPPPPSARKPVRVGVSTDVSDILDSQYSVLSASTVCASSRVSRKTPAVASVSSPRSKPRAAHHQTSNSLSLTSRSLCDAESSEMTGSRAVRSKLFPSRRVGSAPSSPFLLTARDFQRTTFELKRVEDEERKNNASPDVRRASTVSLGVSAVLERSGRRSGSSRKSSSASRHGGRVGRDMSDARLPVEVDDGEIDYEALRPAHGRPVPNDEPAEEPEVAEELGEDVPVVDEDPSAKEANLVVQLGGNDAARDQRDEPSNDDDTGPDFAVQKLVDDVITATVHASSVTSENVTSAGSEEEVSSLLSDILDRSMRHTAMTAVRAIIDEVVEGVWMLGKHAHVSDHPLDSPPPASERTGEGRKRGGHARHESWNPRHDETDEHSLAELEAELKRKSEAGEDCADLTASVREKLSRVMLPEDKILLTPTQLRASFCTDLQQLELDHGRDLVATLACVLYLSRDVHDADLQLIEETHTWADPPRSSFRTVIQSSSALFRETEDGTWDLFHPAVHSAVRERYLCQCPRGCSLEDHMCHHVATGFGLDSWNEKDGRYHHVVALFYQHELDVQSIGHRRRARALKAYPRHLMLSSGDTFDEVARLITSSDFMVEKLSACGHDDVRDDFDLALGVYMNPGVLTDFRRIIMENEEQLRDDPSSVLDLAFPTVPPYTSTQERAAAKNNAGAEDDAIRTQETRDSNPLVQRVNTVAKADDVHAIFPPAKPASDHGSEVVDSDTESLPTAPTTRPTTAGAASDPGATQASELAESVRSASRVAGDVTARAPSSVGGWSDAVPP